MIALDPAQTLEIVLKNDREKSEPPTFISRYLTCREWMQYRKSVNAAPETEDEPYIDILCGALRLGLIGWRNVRSSDGRELPFSVDALPGLLTFSEMWELIGAVAATAIVSEDDRKKFVSPSPSVSAPVESVMVTQL